MTGDTSGPGICFCQLRDGHSPSTPLGSFPDPVSIGISSWHLTISHWDFSHGLDLCRCLQLLISTFEVCGIYQSWLPICRAQPYWAYSAEGQEPSHTHQWLGRAGLMSCTGYWVNSLLVSGEDPPWMVQSFISAVIHWSSFITFPERPYHALSMHGAPQCSHSPEQLRESPGCCLSPVFLQTTRLQQTGAMLPIWNTERFKTCFQLSSV